MICVYIADKSAFRDSESYIKYLLERYHSLSSPILLKTENGKPYVEGNAVYFSLSHTKEKYFLAVAPFPVGIDAERSDRVVSPTVAERYFKNETFPDKKSLLVRWLKTESKVKYLGSTLAKELASPSKDIPVFSLCEVDNHTICVCSEKTASLSLIEVN